MATDRFIVQNAFLARFEAVTFAPALRKTLSERYLYGVQ